MFRSLSLHNYRLWFVGALVSNIGGWMQSTTQDWVVLTQLTNNNALAVGTTMALQFGPQLVLVPLTGSIIDRFDRRRVLFVTQSALMLLAVGLGLVLLLGHAELWHVYLFALGLGIVNAFDAPARQTFVSDVVAGENMSNAVALNAASFNTARLIGPAVAGFLIVLVGSGWVFIINAFTFLAMLTALALLRRNELAQRPRVPRAQSRFSQGFRYIGSRPDLVLVFVIVFLISAFGLNFPIFASTMAVMFGQGAGEYGLLSSILAIGSLAGALLSARRASARLRVVIAASGLFGAAACAAALMPTYWSFAISLVLVGFSTVTLLTTANGYVQSTTPPEIRGRVIALYMAILMGSTLIGAPTIGWVANTWGARWGLGVASIAAVLAFLIGIGWLAAARGMRVGRVGASRWRLGLAFDATPTAAIAVTDAGGARHTPTPGAVPRPPRTSAAPLPVGSGPASVLADAALVPEDFSEQVALTTPLTLPKLPQRETHPRPGSSTGSTTRPRTR